MENMTDSPGTAGSHKHLFESDLRSPWDSKGEMFGLCSPQLLVPLWRRPVEWV